MQFCQGKTRRTLGCTSIKSNETYTKYAFDSSIIEISRLVDNRKAMWAMPKLKSKTQSWEDTMPLICKGRSNQIMGYLSYQCSNLTYSSGIFESYNISGDDSDSDDEYNESVDERHERDEDAERILSSDSLMERIMVLYASCKLSHGGGTPYESLCDISECSDQVGTIDGEIEEGDGDISSIGCFYHYGGYFPLTYYYERNNIIF